MGSFKNSFEIFHVLFVARGFSSAFALGGVRRLLSLFGLDVYYGSMMENGRGG